jgi:signal transduction histidine kinase
MSPEVGSAAADPVDTWLGKLSHDLRNQLAPMRTATQMLQIGGLDPARQREMLDLIERQVLRMARMLEDVSELGQCRDATRRPALERLDFGILLDSAVGEVGRHITAASQQLDHAVPDARVPILGERARLLRSIVRLLDNAHRFTPAAGRISLRIEVEGDWASLSVADSGAGIAADQLDSIFDLPTSRREAAGLGLSLHLARACARAHGGSLDARSAGVDQGSEFVLRLPLAS